MHEDLKKYETMDELLKDSMPKVLNSIKTYPEEEQGELFFAALLDIADMFMSPLSHSYKGRTYYQPSAYVEATLLIQEERRKNNIEKKIQDISTLTEKIPDNYNFSI